MQLLQQKQEETMTLRKQNKIKALLNKNYGAFPSLLDYLLCLWAVAEQHKNVKKVTFSLIANLLEEAFIAPKKEVNWEELLQQPEVKTFYSSPKTREYYHEIRQYERFEKEIRNYVVDLKLLQKSSSNHRSRWENLTTEFFLERGTVFLDDSNWSDANIDGDCVTWLTLTHVLQSGRYTE